MSIKSLLKSMSDERFILHRFKSTRFAVVVTVISMASYFYYEMFVNSVIRKDLFVFMGILAVSKVGAMIYYKITN